MSLPERNRIEEGKKLEAEFLNAGKLGIFTEE